jgi:hypothetical protein
MVGKFGGQFSVTNMATVDDGFESNPDLSVDLRADRRC